MGLVCEPAMIASITPEAIYAFVQSHPSDRGCPGTRCSSAARTTRRLGALSLLKITYDVPIVTSNLAVLQAVKRELDGLRERACSD